MSEKISEYVNKLKIKLLDITRRNPLISTTFSDRNHSHIRLVDELPEKVFEKISNNKMTMIPLPGMDEVLPDEQTDVFKKALIEAKNTDEVYLKQIQKHRDSAEVDVQVAVNIDRDLIDRVRSSLGLPKRIWNEKSVVEHAKQHHINPSYELPLSNEFNHDGRHEDEYLQTLLLPEMLERRAEKIASKCKSWSEETGIDVLYIAYGFLEWKEDKNTKSQMSPLVLQPVSISKRVTREGVRFEVGSEDKECENNISLAFKLKNDFGIEFPEFDPNQHTLEEYFEEVSEITPGRIDLWKVKRQVVVGIFPSSKQVMYNDLNSDKWNYSDSGLLEKIFSGDSNIDANESIDEEVESPDPYGDDAPWLVLDADSSQFKVITTVMNGENCAVEGPPGTGKSQTIVNTISSAIAEGKKVLFVAEKNAALTVVKNRLDSIGVGEFCLPILGGKQTRADVYERIKKRVELGMPRDPKDFYEDYERLVRIKSELDSRNEVLSRDSLLVGYSNYDILSKVIFYSSVLEDLPSQAISAAGDMFLTNDSVEFEKNLEHISILEREWRKFENCDNQWLSLRKINLTRFDIDNIKNHLENIINNTESILTLLRIIDEDNWYDECSFHSLTRIFELVLKYNIGDIPDLKVGEKLVCKNLNEILSLKNELEGINNFNVCNVLENAMSNLVDSLENLKSARKFYYSIQVSMIHPEILNAKETILKSTIQKMTDSIEAIRRYRNDIPEIERISFPVLRNILCDSSFENRKFREVLTHILSNDVRIDDLSDFVRYIDSVNNEHQQLKEFFNEDIINLYDNFGEMAKLIGESGFFSFFSPKFRKVKRIYKQINPGKFNRTFAVNHLLRIHNTKQLLANLRSSKLGEKLLGKFFHGEETSVDIVKDIIDYLKSSGVRNELELSSIVNFINSVNDSMFNRMQNELLPILEEALNYESVENILKEVEKVRCELDNFLSESISVRKCFNEIFVGYSEIRVEHIDGLIANLNQVNGICEILNEFNFSFENHGSKLQNIKNSSNTLIRFFDFTVDLLNKPEYEKQIVLGLIQGKSKPDYINLCSEIKILVNNTHHELRLICENLGMDEEKWYPPLKECLHFFKWHLTEAATIKDIMDMKRSEEFLSSSNVLSTILKLKSMGISHNLVSIYESLFFREVARRSLSNNLDLNQLLGNDGQSLTKLREEFARLDHKHISDTRKALRSLLCKNARPDEGQKADRKKNWTGMCFIRNEINKSKRFNSIRTLVGQSKRALLELMPCWMMSPIAVSQYLEKGAVDFDLVIIDEASQMTPENGLGSLLRAKQAMIVGDTNQLPPTNFFNKTFGNQEDNDDEDFAITDESILEMANLAFYPQKRLRWHYRSKHSGLISFSNKFVYNDDLEIFPAPNESDSSLGVSLIEVEGLYSNGTNLIEASKMIKTIQSEVRAYPDRSLGVVTMNQKQQDLIQEELNFAIKDDIVLKEYIDKWDKLNDGIESFFIKNLESVQGDERDTIFIGTVYGPATVGGAVMQRFGPINGPSGKRRLNVLFTRAKKRIVTFTSMKPTDILAKVEKNAGAWMLKKWVEYSKTGLLDASIETMREPDSDFERHVIQLLESMGCIVVPQVGVSGYYIDIGVKHPSWSFGFLFGVECDGATYHSSKEARDRDRLREQVLNEMGWDLHRIWSTSWFDDPQREAERLRVAIKEKLKKVKYNL